MRAATIHWLSPELRWKIFELVNFPTKKNLRLVHPNIRDEIDECDQFEFNVKLTVDTGIYLVENLTFPRIDYLNVEQWFGTTMMDFRNLPPIHTIVFGEEISLEGMRLLILLCNQNSVQKLKFGDDFAPPGDMEIEQMTLNVPRVKTLEIVVGRMEFVVHELRDNSSRSIFLRKVISDNFSTLKSIAFLSNDDLAANSHVINLGNFNNIQEFEALLDSTNSNEIWLANQNQNQVMPPESMEIDEFEGANASGSDDFGLGQEMIYRSPLPGGGEEFKFRPSGSGYLGVAKIGQILSTPNIRKLTLLEIDTGAAEFMARRCMNQISGISCTLVPVIVTRERGKRNLSNLHIEK